MAESVRTPEIEDRVIAGLESGTPLAALCREIGIGLRTVYDWRDADSVFSARFARAREVGFDVIAEDALHIANTPVDGIIEKTDATGTTITKEDALGHRKLQIETRLKLLAKWDPKRYGDRVTHQGDATADPIQHAHKPDFSGLSKAERDAVRAILEAHPPQPEGGNGGKSS